LSHTHSFSKVVVCAVAMQVVSELIKLHKSASTLRATAKCLGLQLDQMLPQQLQYIAAYRSELTADVQQLCKQQLLLLDSSGQVLVPDSNRVAHLPPADTATLQILQDLMASGRRVRVLSSCYAAIWQDAESQLVLTKLLGLRQADAATALCSMVDVHSRSRAGVKPMSGKRRLQHLTYLAQQRHVLEADQQLRATVQEAVDLHDDGGNLAAASDLFFPLGSTLAVDLQQDMRAAGMRFLHKRYAGAQGLRELLRLLGVRTATAGVVAPCILRLYADGQEGVSEQQRRRHLEFFADDIRLLEEDSHLLQLVKGQVQLQDSNGCYTPPESLHHTLSTEFASLQEDMLAAGMLFLHSSYLARSRGTLQHAASASSSSSSTTSASATGAATAAQRRLMGLLEMLGVVTPGFGVVTRRLLQLYQDDRSIQFVKPTATMSAEQHLRHIDFLAEHITLLQGSESSLLQDLQQHVLLWEDTGCRRTAAELFFSLGADTAELQADVMGAGMHFVHSMYQTSRSGVSSAVRKQLLSQLGVREPDKLAVACYLVQLHRDTDASAITEQQRCRHLAFLADNMQLLKPNSSTGGGGSDTLLQSAQQHLHLQTVDGSYLPAKQLWFPPKADEADLLPDLAAEGMQFVHDSYGSSGGSKPQAEKLLQLLELLRVDYLRSSDIFEHLTRLHEADSKAVTEQQRSRHLAFFATNMHQLPAEGQPGVLRRLQERLLLQDSAGSYRLAGNLLFPLSTGMSNLQASMDASGMPFLHSSYTDAPARTGSRAGSARGGGNHRRQSLFELLFELRVQEADADMVTAYILKLYPSAAGASGSSTDLMPFDQHMTHLCFFSRQWSNLAETTQAAVCQKLQLRLQAGCSCAVSTAAAAAGSADSCSPLFLLPPPHTALAGVLQALQQGGALFLSDEYSTAAACLQSAVDRSKLPQWFRAALGVELLCGESVPNLSSQHTKSRTTSAHAASRNLSSMGCLLLQNRSICPAQANSSRLRHFRRLPSSTCSSCCTAPLL
jgi:hypothetical protein